MQTFVRTVMNLKRKDFEVLGTMGNGQKKTSWEIDFELEIGSCNKVKTLNQRWEKKRQFSNKKVANFKLVFHVK